MSKPQHVSDELLVLDIIPPAERVFEKSFDTQISCFWSPKELKFIQDASDINKLNPKARALFEYILAFFATADGEVLDNVVVRFQATAKSLPVRMAYTAQGFFESIHIKTYAMALTVYIPDPAHRKRLTMAFKTDPLIKERDEWMTSYMAGTLDAPEMVLNLGFAKGLIAFACAEGLFFMSAFMVIAWLQSQSMFPVFGLANQFIARDEWSHVCLGLEYFKFLFSPAKREAMGLSNEDILNIVKEAVELETRFATFAVPSYSDTERLEGLRCEDLITHIQNLGNRILEILGLPKNWVVDLPGLPPWYKWIELMSKNNFYEVDGAAYTIPTACSANPDRDENF